MKRVVIVGGGYGGVAALRRLASVKDIEVVLIDQHPYHFLQTEGYALVAGTLPFEDTIVNLHTLCASYKSDISFIHASVRGVDFEQKKVFYHDDSDIGYDYLILAAGSKTRFLSSIEGLRRCSHGVKSLLGAFKMRQFFENELFLRLENAQHAKEYYSVVIGGAGLSGVEIAAQMQYYFNQYYKSNTLACATLQIHLISASSEILKGMHPKTVRMAEDRLKKLGVVLHLGAHIQRVDTNHAFLENGDKIAFDFMIFTGGIIASSLVKEIDITYNKIEQIVVDRYLQVPQREGAYAIGDIAEIRDKQGARIPDTAQVAIKSGICAAENIKRDIVGKPLLEARITIKGLAIALGGRYAIVDVGAIRICGIVGYYIKKIVENFYKWPLWIRCRYGFRQTTSCQI